MSRYKLGYAKQAKHGSFGRNEGAAHQQARFLFGKSLIPGPGLKQRVCGHPQLVVPAVTPNPSDPLQRAAGEKRGG